MVTAPCDFLKHPSSLSYACVKGPKTFSYAFLAPPWYVGVCTRDTSTGRVGVFSTPRGVGQVTPGRRSEGSPMTQTDERGGGDIPPLLFFLFPVTVVLYLNVEKLNERFAVE
ncbi:hypothetical protein CEXT_38581 [Caerostris extrusa]|uniref:Uncharacterized protein n=1 Tax=Caerostris extrusa TaxID=172846 RepID=A0AAV4VUB9_CAEEX|nr:hypothetical protein CEXT_38581 [Caerostris extrusa]